MTALLCLEGDQHWQPISSWPQFVPNLGSAPVHAVAADPTPPPLPAIAAESPLILVQSRGTSGTGRVPDSIQTAAVYGKIVSPIIFVLGTFSCIAFLPFSYSNSISLAFVVGSLLFFLEVAARLTMFVGAMAMRGSPKDGSGMMAVGGWLLVGSAGLNILTSFVSLPGTQSAEVEVPEAFLGLFCIMLPVFMIELCYVCYMLFVLHGFRDHLQRR